MKFRKKPVVIDAVLVSGGNREEIMKFLGTEEDMTRLGWEPEKRHIYIIHTLEGDMRANEGDWLIKGVKGEFYPCKPDIFAETYDLVGE